ncbi:MAG: hypothetical protein WDO69_17905 [Pseudomonadota bacterium]
MSHPLSRLFEHARRYRREVVVATLFSVLNKIFDVCLSGEAPSLPIGVPPPALAFVQ